MMKIQMLKNMPRPGYFPPLPCYLAGQTYELATTEEIAMGKGFIRDGAAVAVGGLVKGDIPGKDFIPVLAGTGGFIVSGDGTGEALPPASAEVREAPGVTVVVRGAAPTDAEVVKAVDKALKRAKPRK